ncbi:MAG: chromosome segregation protein SMC [Chitinophagaceae bacterium]|nr:chromosome segregation protein SMC [Chitinophagaceae bacterium]
MRLKSLEIKGFKSFADKTILSFDQDITGIIGPNGCGKSNIIDSIRWVIGEQKISQLRSENLDSLVFNGSKNRSASGLAEVSLTFENTRNLLPTEFNTVTVTRKYFRNGDSEYRLNDVSCRLKDIHNLFMDTGISTDSYAIIELGMVDDIIKDKDNSRRRMLEQAAGITIYKTRKREARLKLESTEHDLARIEDLLFEINNQLKSLENQAKKAEKYFEIKLKYKETSIELAKAALEGFNLTYQELTQTQHSETDKKTQLEAGIAGKEAEIEKDKVDFIGKENALHTLQTSFNEITSKLHAAKGQEDLSAQRMNYLKEKQQSLNDFILKAEGQLKGINESISFTNNQLEEERNKLDSQIMEVQKHKDSLEEKRIDFENKRKGLEESRNELLQLQRSRFDAEKIVAVADTSISNLERGITLLKDEKEQRINLCSQLEKSLGEKQHLLDAKTKELEDLRNQNESLKQEILESQSALENQRNELNAENRILDAKQNEHDLLKSLVDKMEGYPESVKFLHNQASWLKDAPLLSDVLYVKEEYRAAVENLLDNYLNYYIVSDSTEAMQSITLLENNKKGKAKFFILNELPQKSEEEKNTNEGLISALDVVEVDEKYKPLAQYLLSNVGIAEDEDSFLKASGIVLEKSGRMVKGDYSLSGGSVGLFEGKKIGRAKNLEKLASQIAEQKKKTQSLDSLITEKSRRVIELNGMLKDKQIQELQRELISVTNEVNAVKNKLESQQQQGELAEKRIEDLNRQLSQAQSGINDTRSKLEQLLIQTASQEKVLEQVQSDFSVSEERFNTSNRFFHEADLQLTRQQSKVQALKQELEFKNRQLQDLAAQAGNSRTQLEETRNQMLETDSQLQLLHKELSDLMHQKEDEERILNEAESQFHIFRNELAEKENQLRQLQRSKEQSELAVNSVKDKLNELKLQLAGMKERLMVEFKVNLDEILDESRTSEKSKEELQEQNERYKKRLENLGEVNPMAIEAFTEMKKRFDFITEQKGDLVDAKQSLLQTIEEVESTANQKFLDTFNKVRDNFKSVFQALFTEDDTADLILENPENLAETGVDIMAKPRGKRPTSITQLSGGEKTLTATALLFAIYLIKPAPFCILDEVDAPLDDLNVQKFTQMIRKFSHESQFIIITHNKMTMASVDVIYGVTMQEPGVSKLVPVDFRGLENEYETVEAAAS